MDTPDWEYYARCSRLKTKRTKKRLQKKDSDKKLIRLSKEIIAINRKLRKPEYEDLEQPYQRGWKRTFVLRNDQKSLDCAPFFEGILKRINTVQLSHRKDFKTKKRKYGKRIFEIKPQLLKTLDERTFRSILFTEKEKKYFDEFWEYQAYHKIMIRKYSFTDAWRFVLQISPNMIIRVRMVDTGLVKRDREIDNYLERNNLKARMWKLRKGHYACYNRWNPRPKAKYDNLFKAEPVHKLKREYETEKLYGNKN